MVESFWIKDYNIVKVKEIDIKCKIGLLEEFLGFNVFCICLDRRRIIVILKEWVS